MLRNKKHGPRSGFDKMDTVFLILKMRDLHLKMTGGLRHGHPTLHSQSLKDGPQFGALEVLFS